MSEILIIGCGVSGLTCGIRLLEQGFAVTIVARDLPPDTTSNVAAAIWYPYKAFPEDRVLAWGKVTLDEFYRLMDVPDSGISAVTLREALTRPAPDPWWKAAVRSFRRAAPDELPRGYRDGYVVEIPLIETPTYMRYLMRRYSESGGRIEQGSVSRLAELTADHRLIVNCAGVGAREVAGDESVYPIRGQVVRVERLAGVGCWLAEDAGDAPTYIIPRGDDCILGGTSQDNNWSLDADAETAADILRRCQQIEPTLKDAAILEHRVGLRPGRPEVRLELEAIDDTCAVIHNYGHGGAGFTLSWGCADEVASLAAQWAREVDRLSTNRR